MQVVCFWVLDVVSTNSTVSQALTHVAWAQVLQGQTTESYANHRLCGASLSPSVLAFFCLSHYSQSMRGKTCTIRLYLTIRLFILTLFLLLSLNLSTPCLPLQHFSISIHKKPPGTPLFWPGSRREDGRRGSLSDLSVEWPVKWKGLLISCPFLTP